MGMKVQQFIGIGVLVLIVVLFFIMFRELEGIGDYANNATNVSALATSAVAAFAVIGSLLVLVVLALIFPMVINAFKKMGGKGR